MQRRNEMFKLGWLDPRDGSVNHAGVSFYNPTYGEYLLKIDEEPSDKQYFLKPCVCEGEHIRYRMELVIKRRDGRFLKRQHVGTGYSNDGYVFIDYGSKFKTLVLYLNPKRSETRCKRSLGFCERSVGVSEAKGEQS